MTIANAVEKRISRLRKPYWNEKAYARLMFNDDGTWTPIVDLFDRFSRQGIATLRGTAEQVDRIPVIMDRDTDWLIYEGDLDPMDALP